MLHLITIQTQGIYRIRRVWSYLLTRSTQRHVTNVDFLKESDMSHGSNFWVIGGEFGSMNFHKLVEGSAQVQGPFKSRKEAEAAWKTVSEENRHRAGVRFSIVEEPSRQVA
jgi:hypothetical protein